MAYLLDGRTLAATIRQDLKHKIAERSLSPTLGIILVGDDPASHLYVALKEKAAAEVGIGVVKVLLPKGTDFGSVAQHLKSFNQRPDITGILVQLPLPPPLNEHQVIELMDPAKDADGFHPQNLKRLLAGEAAITPGVTHGIVKLIELAGLPLGDKTAALLVNSQEFAQPLIKLLGERLVRCSVLSTPEPTTLALADIVVVALGRPGILTSDMVKDGTIVIDVGTTKVGSRVVGDAAPELIERNIYLTPVPGGVGPMTVAMLLWNVYQLSQPAKH